MRLAVILATMVATLACGKKGPPLAPFVRLPATVANVTAQRIDTEVFLSFPVPAANVDGRQPADIEALKVYAVTSARPPATKEQRAVATLVATIPVRPIMPEPPASANGSAPPPVPLPPGVDQGSTAVVRETLASEAYVPIELPLDERERALNELKTDTEGYVPMGPLVAPPPTQFPRRHYFVVGIGPRGRESAPSAPVSVPLETVTSAPGAPKLSHDEKVMTVSWPPSPDARTATFLPSASAREASGELRRDLAGAASGREGGPPPTPTNGSPSTVKPPAPPLTAKSLGFNTEATLYHLYDVSSNASPPDPYAIKIPTPVTPAPVATTEWVIPDIVFGVERCFEVRPVDKVGEALVIGPASPRRCLTPADTFAPAAPRNLAAIAGAGAINLIWDANTEADIAGYLVLRAEAPSATLQPVTPAPVPAATYRDDTAKPGVRYVYSVVAVDRAGNRSGESNRMEETAR